MKSYFPRLIRLAVWSSALALLASACAPLPNPAPDRSAPAKPADTPTPTPQITPLPTRQLFEPGQLVDYTVQTGDTLPALAIRFNTSEEEIRAANPIIPISATTLPPGMPMKIPIYYLPLWGTSYQIIPDQLFINGPAQIGADTQKFVASQPGWLKFYQEYIADGSRTGAELVDIVARHYSVSPRLLLAILDYQTGALSRTDFPTDLAPYFMGSRDYAHKSLYLQLGWAANLLNDGYYSYRQGKLPSFEHLDGRLERPDPWQNAATVAIQYYFSRIVDGPTYDLAISGEGLAKTYSLLFGNPWKAAPPHIPGSLTQPELRLPFEPDRVWAYTGGPHTGWGDAQPYAALDFAPPSLVSGCVDTDQWVTAIAPGVIAFAEPGLAILDLDGDGDIRTGWTIFYLHLATRDEIAQGAIVKAGDHMGHPSCQEGHATGTHIHIARLFNGEWIPAGGIGGNILAFNMEGWEARAGDQAYVGTLVKFGQVLHACTCSDVTSQLASSFK
ncbi:MAG TPA: LysM peptidoglycan-binding domain-containing protein [Anaerolineaceae bacterium]|nr:LysM peptidoglycan-binding domain-containing protein [Anaerolineaceae bacterium]